MKITEFLAWAACGRVEEGRRWLTAYYDDDTIFFRVYGGNGIKLIDTDNEDDAVAVLRGKDLPEEK